MVAVAAGSAAKVKAQVARPDPLVAPFIKGQSWAASRSCWATTRHRLPEVPLVALETVEEAGIVGRAWDSIRLWIK